jgi:membrane associated rhomboid family serine protease
MANPAPREPVFNLPGATLVLIVAILGVHALRAFLADETNTRITLDYGFIPLRFWIWAAPEFGNAAALDLIAAGRVAGSETARFAAWIAASLLREPAQIPYTALSYGLLHGDWSHAVVNTVWLAVFGSAVERRIGAARFLMLFSGGVMAGAAFELLFDSRGVLPQIGASAGVSACFGAAARFVFARNGPLLRIGRGDPQAFRQPLAGIGSVFTNRQSLSFVVVWFVMNLLFGYFAEPLGISSSPIAWLAHIGGFVFGLLALPLLERRSGR